MVPSERDNDRDVHDLHHHPELFRRDRPAGDLPPAEGHEMDAGQDHGSQLAQVRFGEIRGTVGIGSLCSNQSLKSNKAD